MSKHLYIFSGIALAIIFGVWIYLCCKNDSKLTDKDNKASSVKKQVTAPQSLRTNIDNLAASSFDANPPPSYPTSDIPKTDATGTPVLPPAASIANFSMNTCDSIPANEFWTPIQTEYEKNVDKLIKLSQPYVYQNPSEVSVDKKQ